MSAKDTLRSNKTGLQTTLCLDRKFILNKVHEKNLITQREYNNLKSIAGENDEIHVIELVDKIMNKGEERCRDFLDLLQTDEDIKSTYPELSKMKLYVARPLSTPVQVSSASSEVPVEEDDKRQKDDFYPLNSKPVGLCLIINNENFMDGSKRRGSGVDAQSLAEVFSWLGFRVLMCKDQTKDQMERTLACFASLTNPAQLQQFNVEEWSGRGFTKAQPVLNHGDAFICCVLSHGDVGVVEGVDWKPVSIKDITTTFKATEQSALKGKPKLFLIQACQGHQVQRGVSLPGLEKDEKEEPQRGESDLQEDDSGSRYIPMEADFLVAIATVEDSVSVRHIIDGSWFVQSVCQQLKERCLRGGNLLNILTHVNNDVSQKEGTSKPGEKKQMPISWFTLRKTLVLSPHRN